ncbi:flagellar protein FliT [Aneurinibacillus migulanus]|uniref:flagellar protein FliT n=1 Tax=Aneurinibacillus migulanus TaxID=47500 RepID=UPI002E23DA7C|nr:flagellar protein FliT [Aneurinibacillus migulanus]
MYGEKKQHGLKEVLVLTQQLISALQEERYEEIDDLMIKRQQTMDVITQLDTGIDSYLFEQERKRLLPLLENIWECDRKFMDLAQMRKQEASSAIQKIQMSRKLNLSYQQAYSNQDGYYIDQTIGSRKR